MFGRKNHAQPAKPTDIVSHWPQLIEKLQCAPQDFYAKIERALEERQVPDLTFSRVEWPEGGLLSDRREYLRIARERLVFDVCAAPFGTGFFVSIWFGEKPLKLGGLAASLLAVIVFGSLDYAGRPNFGLYHFLWSEYRIPSSTTSLGILSVAAALVLAVLIRVGPNLDVFLMGLPIIGYVYERYFRKITFYRIDRMCMYQQAVHAAVAQVIDDLTTAQCIKPLSEFTRRPVMRDLFDLPGRHARR